MTKIYHNPRCRKSRAGLELAQQKFADLQIVDYIKEGLSLAAVEEIVKTTGIKPEELLRKQEAIFKSDFKGKNLTDQQWMQAIADNPKLLKRPIVIKNNIGVWADPPENLNNLR